MLMTATHLELSLIHIYCFQTIDVHLMGNLVDIIGYTGQVTDCRYHFRTDTLTNFTAHCSLLAKFIDRQSSLLLSLIHILKMLYNWQHGILMTKIQ